MQKFHFSWQSPNPFLRPLTSLLAFKNSTAKWKSSSTDVHLFLMLIFYIFKKRKIFLKSQARHKCDFFLSYASSIHTSGSSGSHTVDKKMVFHQNESSYGGLLNSFLSLLYCKLCIVLVLDQGCLSETFMKHL